MNLKKINVMALLIITSLSIISVATAEAPTPGSVTDPVITKSYFDQNTLSEAKVKEIVAAALAANAGTGSGSSSAGSSATPSVPAAAAGITVIQLKADQTLYAGAGSEFIVRSGKTVAVSNDENGIPDVTAGKDITNGSAIELNHLLIFPREGRGIKPAPKNTADIYVMVRGSYLLLNADGSTATP